MTGLFSGEIRPRRRAIIVSILTASTLMLGLAGCAPEAAPEPTTAATVAPTDTPTPEPTFSAGVEAPASADEAIEIATTVADQFVELTNSSSIAGEVDVPLMSLVASDPALANQVHSAETIRTNSYTVTGGSTIEVLSAYTSTVTDSDAVIPFGSVTLSACFDTSGRTITLPDGTDAPSAPNQRSLRDINVVYSAGDGAWRVRTFIAAEGEC